MTRFPSTYFPGNFCRSLERYVGGKCLRVGRGKAWREIKAWTIALPRVVDMLPLPSVSEPFLAGPFPVRLSFKSSFYTFGDVQRDPRE